MKEPITCWIFIRKDGTTIKDDSVRDDLPVPGDGKVFNGVPYKVTNIVTGAAVSVVVAEES